MSGEGVIKLWPKLVLFGDSITQFGFSDIGGWISLIANAYQRKLDVISRGFSGYNTRWCLELMPSIFNKENLKNTIGVTVFLGANDASLTINKKQHVPIKEFEENLEKIILTFGTYGIPKEKVIIISPPPIDEINFAVFCRNGGYPLNRLFLTTKQYSEVAVAVAKRNRCAFVDYHSIVLQQDDWQTCLCDGLHLSQRGSTLLFKQLKPILDDWSSKYPVMFPIWDQVEPKDPKESFATWLEEHGDVKEDGENS